MTGHKGEFDLVVRGGLVVDGTGEPAKRADVAVIGDQIVAVGEVEGRGRRELDADGQVVAPGFVDAHTHMDAQVFWDDLGKPTCWHGVTTVVMGNCGFTLAPARQDERALVVRNLERAEDIAPEAMAQGIEWTWSTFAEYLDAVEARPKGLNHAASIGHSALRTFVMGERAFDEIASDPDLAAMAEELRSALRAGAAGFTTSRTIAHATSDDRPVASRLAAWDEVAALVDIVGKESDAIFQLAPERLFDAEQHRDFERRLSELAISSGAPVVFGKFSHHIPQPSIELMEETARRGGEMFALTHCRGVVSAQSFQTRLGFDALPEWQEVRRRPPAEQQVLLRDPAVRVRLVHAAQHGDYQAVHGPEAGRPRFETMTVLDSPYLPNPTVADEARRRGVDPVEAMIDIALERDFDVFFVQHLMSQDEDELLQLMRHPRTAMCFSDSGAHVSQIFDSSIYTHLLAYWVRERGLIGLEEAVRMITSRPAEIWRLHDRGRLAAGYAADLTIFDPDTIAPLLPHVVDDLPGGAKRIEQHAEGISTTIVNGRILTQGGEPTDDRPGRLLRAPISGGADGRRRSPGRGTPSRRG
jgi:N-acyl-D-aspartate/D-glutamate deacylase